MSLTRATIDCSTGQVTVIELSADEEAAIQAQWAANAFTQTQQQALAAVDAKTQQLLAAGFAYTPQGSSQSYNFALDPASSTNWMGMMMAAASLPYPFTVAAVDGTLVQLSSAQDVQAFFAAGVARSAYIQQGGVSLKAQINAATTVAAVQAIQDTRS